MQFHFVQYSTQLSMLNEVEATLSQNEEVFICKCLCIFFLHIIYELEANYPTCLTHAYHSCINKYIFSLSWNIFELL